MNGVLRFGIRVHHFSFQLFTSFSSVIVPKSDAVILFFSFCTRCAGLLSKLTTWCRFFLEERGFFIYSSQQGAAHGSPRLTYMYSYGAGAIWFHRVADPATLWRNCLSLKSMDFPFQISLSNHPWTATAKQHSRHSEIPSNRFGENWTPVCHSTSKQWFFTIQSRLTYAANTHSYLNSLPLSCIFRKWADWGGPMSFNPT